MDEPLPRWATLVGGLAGGGLMFAADKLNWNWPQPVVIFVAIASAVGISLAGTLWAVHIWRWLRSRGFGMGPLILIFLGAPLFLSGLVWGLWTWKVPSTSSPKLSASSGGAGGVSPVGAHGGDGGDGPVAGGGGEAGRIEQLPGGGTIIHGGAGGGGAGPLGGTGGKGGGTNGGEGGKSIAADSPRPLKRLIAYEAPRLDANGKIANGKTTYYLQSAWAHVVNVSDDTIRARVTRFDVYIDGVRVMNAAIGDDVVVQQTQYVDNIVRSHSETEIPLRLDQKQIRVELEVTYDTIPSTGNRVSGKVILYDINFANGPESAPLLNSPKIVDYIEK